VRALLQRVSGASVAVDGEVAGRIDRGLLVFLAVQAGDGETQCRKLADKVARYRVFPDSSERMNRSVLDVTGSVLVISQFTLAADTRKGLRPSFSSAAEPGRAEALYERFIDNLEAAGVPVATGRFGADMQVSLCNDGPVTFLLET
jgi:D-tyrosyl-tRNA(Tyr) deacylase